MESWGIPIKSSLLSGKLKSAVQTFGKSAETRQMLESDKWIYLLDDWRMTEVKKRLLQSHASIYKLAEEHEITYIEDFCYLMIEDVFHGLLLGQTYDVHEIPDKRLKRIHDYFDQDGAQIVAMISPYGEKNRYKPFVFAIVPKLYQELRVKSV